MRKRSPWPEAETVLSERLLIVNADDLGLAPGVTRGILELAGQGVITSTSLLTTFPHSLDALVAARASGLDTGIHLNLVTGAPLSAPERVPTLIGPGGRFMNAGTVMRRLLARRVRLEEIELEWSRQIEYALDRGLSPSHLDSHCHVHAYPPLYHLTKALARRYGVAGVRPALRGYRLHAPAIHRLHLALPPHRPSGTNGEQVVHFTVLTVLGRLRTLRPLQGVLHFLPPGITELVCHPGHVDDELRRVDTLTVARERELLLLARPLLREVLARERIRLISWRDLARNQ